MIYATANGFPRWSNGFEPPGDLLERNTNNENRKTSMWDRAIAIGGMAVGVSLFAETAVPMGGNDWSNWTALTAVIATLLFIVMKMLPDLHQKSLDQAKTFAETLKDQSAAFAQTITVTQNKYSDTLDKIHDRATMAAATQVEELAKLRENCAGRSAMSRG